MTAETTNPESLEQQVAAWSATESEIIAKVEATNGLTIAGYLDDDGTANPKKGREVVHRALMELVGIRTAIEARRKSLKAPILALGNLVDSEARRLTSLSQPRENELAADRAAYDAEAKRIEDERLAAIEEEKLRLAEIEQARIQTIADQIVELGFKPNFAWLTLASESAVEELLATLAAEKSQRDKAEQIRREQEEREAEARRIQREAEEKELAEARDKAAQIRREQEEREAEARRIQREAEEKELAEARDKAAQIRREQEEREAEARRIQREAEEKELAEARERLRAEQARIKAENDAKEAAFQADLAKLNAEREEYERKLAEEEAERQAEARRIREEAEAAAAKAAAEKAAKEEAERIERERPDREKALAWLSSILDGIPEYPAIENADILHSLVVVKAEIVDLVRSAQIGGAK